MRSASLSLAPPDEQPQLSARKAFSFFTLGLVLTAAFAFAFAHVAHVGNIMGMAAYGGQLLLAALLTLFFFASGIARIFRKRATVPFDQLTRAEQRLLDGLWPSSKPRPKA